MASVALARISGSVLSVPPARSGVIGKGPRQGETWTMESANILVADTNVTAVQLPRRDNTGVFESLGIRELGKGEIVDFLVEVSVYQQDVQTRVLGLWPDDESSEVAA